MANRSRFPRAVRSGPKRTTTWFEFQPAGVTLTTAGGTIIFSLNAAALALRPFTVVRTRLRCHLRTDQTAASEVQVVGFGLAVVSDQASAAGVASVPTPITDMGSDLWFVHEVFMSATYGDSAGGQGAPSGQPFSVDSKAMRKVDIGQDIVVVGEFAAAGNGAILITGGRMLVKNN